MVSLNNETQKLIKINQNNRKCTGQQMIIKHAIRLFLDKYLNNF